MLEPSADRVIRPARTPDRADAGDATSSTPPCPRSVASKRTWSPSSSRGWPASTCGSGRGGPRRTDRSGMADPGLLRGGRGGQERPVPPPVPRRRAGRPLPDRDPCRRWGRRGSPVAGRRPDRGDGLTRRRTPGRCRRDGRGRFRCEPGTSRPGWCRAAHRSAGPTTSSSRCSAAGSRCTPGCSGRSTRGRRRPHPSGAGRAGAAAGERVADLYAGAGLFTVGPGRGGRTGGRGHCGRAEPPGLCGPASERGRARPGRGARGGRRVPPWSPGASAVPTWWCWIRPGRVPGGR